MRAAAMKKKDLEAITVRPEELSREYSALGSRILPHAGAPSWREQARIVANFINHDCRMWNYTDPRFVIEERETAGGRGRKRWKNQFSVVVCYGIPERLKR